MKELNSHWRDHEVTIDGIDDGPEWEGTRYFFGEEKVTVGLFNDDKNLYIRLSSRDKRTNALIMRTGLTIWLDAETGRKKTVGIHFPIGIHAGKVKMMRNMRGKSRNEDPGQMQKMLEDAQNEIEIFGPGKGESRTMLISEVNKLGIKAKIGNSKGNLVYELQVPLDKKESQSYGIGTDAGETISIGFEMGEMDMEQMTRKPREQRNGMGGRGRSGGLGGGRTRRGGGIGGMNGMGGFGGGGRGMPQIPDSLELWLKTRLAVETGNL